MNNMSLKYEVIHLKDCDEWHPTLTFYRHGTTYRKDAPAIMWYNIYYKQGYYKYVSEI